MSVWFVAVMKLKGMIVIWLASCFLTACSGYRGIPPADPRAYENDQDAANWQNPFLIVYPDGVGLVGHTEHIPLEGLAGLLRHLPREAWPYGKVVSVEEVGIGSRGDERLTRENLVRVLEVLTKLGIKAKLWPPG